MDAAAAGAFVQYISQIGLIGAGEFGSQNSAPESGGVSPGDREGVSTGLASTSAPSPKIAIDYLTGGADGIEIMLPQLLSLVNRKTAARQLINTVMQLPESVVVELDKDVRLAKESDIPMLNRWRKLYKEERGIPFDADVDAAIQSQKVFVCQHEEQVVAVAKLDLELNNLVEIGGVYTFPEFRQQGFGTRIVCDLAARIRQSSKIPTLQVDRENTAALHLYHQQGWTSIGALARVWLTG
jgi:ribosomal protein S18 acetylase RimI-like enzyme